MLFSYLDHFITALAVLNRLSLRLL